MWQLKSGQGRQISEERLESSRKPPQRSVRVWTVWGVATVISGSCLSNKPALFVSIPWRTEGKHKTLLAIFHCSAMQRCILWVLYWEWNSERKTEVLFTQELNVSVLEPAQRFHLFHHQHGYQHYSLLSQPASSWSSREIKKEKKRKVNLCHKISNFTKYANFFIILRLVALVGICLSKKGLLWFWNLTFSVFFCISKYYMEDIKKHDLDKHEKMTNLTY